MTTRTGKIAQLPKSIRDQLNHRLENGQQSPELLKWVNGLPKTKKLLAKKFDNQPITKSNLSDWRHGGYQEWRMDQAREARIQRISESGTSLERAETGDLFENFARIAVAELMADLDSLQKLSGEKRSHCLHNLVRDLARLQNSYNRSRWADLAWTKWNHRFLGPEDYESDENSKPEPNDVTPSSVTSVVPDGGQSCGVASALRAETGAPHDSQAQEPYDPFKIIHHTRCECGEPCPKCHAPDSEYPLDEVLRDQQFYQKHGHNPCDRHGRSKHLINYECDCFCDRCAEKRTALASALRAETDVASALRAESNVTSALRADSKPVTNPEPQPPISPMSPIAFDPRADFLRKMSHLRNAAS